MMGRAAMATMLAGLAVLGVFSTASCATATGEVSGGESVLDSSAPDTGTVVDDSGVGPTDGGATDANAADTAPAAPVSWSELYTDYFGPTGAAGCAGSVGACHGTMAAQGYMASDFLCPPGDSAGCYAGLTDPASGLLVTTPFAKTYLYLVLRKQVGTNLQEPMPKSPNYVFSQADMAKIQSWFEAGMKND